MASPAGSRPPAPRLPFEEDERDGGRRLFGLLVAVLVHLLAGAAIVAIKPIERVRQVWVEAVMVEPEPAAEPPPPPELKPEPPPPPKERPREVEYQQTVDAPSPDAPVETAPADKPVRTVQGLSATSFATGSGTGFSVRAGTTLRTRAGEETMDLDEARNSVAFTALTRQPKVKSKPALQVPASVQELRLKGPIEVLVDIDEQGRVRDVRLVKGLHPDADRACLEAWRQAVFSPAMQGDRAVAVRNAPFRCRIEQIP